MSRYIKAIDVWEYSDAIRAGQIKLQTGQWIKLGQDNKRLSRFHNTNGSSITAFHYPRHVTGFMAYSKAMKGAK